MYRLVNLALAIGLVAGLGACAGDNKLSFPGEPMRSFKADKGAASTPVYTKAPTAAVDPNALYARLGQRAGIEAVVTDFVNRVAKDPRINKRFANTDAKAFIAKLTDQICQASGGPCTYAGKDMRAAHAGMQITNREWNITVLHLRQAMQATGVGQKEQRELLALLGPMKGDIVGH